MGASDASTSIPEESESGAADASTDKVEAEYIDDSHTGTKVDAKYTDESGYFLIFASLVDHWVIGSSVSSVRWSTICVLSFLWIGFSSGFLK